jgi:hypothetical protein
VIVIDDATVENVCRWKEVLVVTSRDLALNGSAAITLLPNDALDEASRAPATIEYAISRPFRPWHEQRRFSREARGLTPYRRPDKPAKPTEVSLTSSEPHAASPAEAADPAPAQ